MPIFSLFLSTLVKYVAISLLIGLLTKKPKSESQQSASLSDFSVNTVEDGRPLPILFGRVRIAPNIIYYGGLGKQEQKKTVVTKMFFFFKSKQEVSLGWNYYMTIWYMLSFGSIDAIKAVYYSNKKVWSGSASGNTNFNVNGTYYENELRGGISGQFKLHSGLHISGDRVTRSKDPALVALLGSDNVPAYPFYSHLVLNNCFIGSNATIGNLELDVFRLPSTVEFLREYTYSALTSDIPATVATVATVGEGANPALCLAEVLLEHLPEPFKAYDLDRDSFLKAAIKLKEENHSFSAKLESSTKAEDFVLEILKQINGNLYTDLASKQVVLALLRAADESTLVLDEGNIKGITDLAIAASHASPTTIRVPYTSITNWKEGFAVARDVGAIAMRNADTNTQEVKYVGVADPNLAASLALRDLGVAASPLRKFSIKAALRHTTNLHLGQLLTINYPPMNLSNVKVRIVKFSFAAAHLHECSLEVIQDVFSNPTEGLGSVYVPPEASNPLPPSEVTELVSFPAPYYFAPYEIDVDLLYAFAPDANTSFWRPAFCQGGTFDDGSSVYTEQSSYKFSFKATLNNALPYTSAATSLNITLSDAPSIALCPSSLSAVWLRIGTELIYCSSATRSGNVLSCNVKRGVLNTQPGEYAAGAVVHVIQEFAVAAYNYTTTLNSSNGVRRVFVDGVSSQSVQAEVGNSFYRKAVDEVLNTFTISAPSSTLAPLPVAPGCVKFRGSFGGASEATAVSLSNSTSFTATAYARSKGTNIVSFYDTTSEVLSSDETMRCTIKVKPSGSSSYTTANDGAFAAGSFSYTASSLYAAPCLVQVLCYTRKTYSDGSYVDSKPVVQYYKLT